MEKVFSSFLEEVSKDLAEKLDIKEKEKELLFYLRGIFNPFPEKMIDKFSSKFIKM